MRFKVLAEDRDDPVLGELGGSLRVAAENRGHQTADGDEVLGFIIGLARTADAEVDLSRGVPIFLARRADGEMWTTSYRMSDFYAMAGFEELQPGNAAVVERFEEWLSSVEEHEKARERQRLALDTEVRLAVEEFATFWQELKAKLNLDVDDIRIGDAYVLMASEVVKTSEPPPGAMREAFTWFLRKIDTVATAAAHTFGVGVGLAATAQLPRMQELARNLVSLLHG
jgi:hypothetical protein